MYFCNIKLRHSINFTRILFRTVLKSADKDFTKYKAYNHNLNTIMFLICISGCEQSF